jgi:DNA-binding NtrC family response regulator
VGAFEAANGGTIFLDEIGDLPLHLQPTLLRVLEEMAVRPLGSAHEVKLDVRVVAATHQSLLARIEEGTFREDLFHRLNAANIRIPALRDRTDDILPLARHFLDVERGERRRRFSAECERRLQAHDWPGNVRELRNVVRRAIFECDGEVIRPEHLEFVAGILDESNGLDPRERLRRAEVDEKELLVSTLIKCDQNRAATARELGMPRNTLQDKLVRHGIGRKRDLQTRRR